MSRPLEVDGALETAESFVQAWGAMLNRLLVEGRDVDPRDCSSAFALLHDALVEVRALRALVSDMKTRLLDHEDDCHESETCQRFERSDDGVPLSYHPTEPCTCGLSDLLDRGTNL